MKKKSKVTLIFVAVLILLLAASVWGFKTKLENDLNAVAEVTIQDINFSQIPDGTYTGQYSAFPVAVVVNVTVLGNRVTVIDLVKHDNGQGKPAEVIIDQVIEKQSLNVDVITGATYSSKVILKSIEQALIESAVKP